MPPRMTKWKFAFINGREPITYHLKPLSNNKAHYSDHQTSNFQHPNRAMMSARMLVPVFVLAACRATLSGAADGAGQRPETFPSVPLASDSKPYYAAVGVDVWNDRASAYLLFDGNPKLGYRRMYVWIPGDGEYGQPGVFTASADGRFAPLEFQSRSLRAGKPEPGRAIVRWVFTAASSVEHRPEQRIVQPERRETRRTGGDTRRRRFDYARGEYVTEGSVTPEVVETVVIPASTRIIPAATITNINFGFQHSVGVGPPESTATTMERMPLHLEWNGSLRAGANWDATAERHFPMASALNLSMRQRARGRVLEGRRREMHFSGGLTDVKIHSLPENAEVILMAAPWRHAPTVESRIPPVEFFARGKTLPLPFGWYEFKWDMNCPWLTIRGGSIAGPLMLGPDGGN